MIHFFLGHHTFILFLPSDVFCFSIMKVLNFHSGILHTAFNELFFHTILLKPVAFHFLDIDLIFPRHLFNRIVLIHFHHVDELAISLNLLFVDKFSLAIDFGFFSQNGFVEKILLFGLIFLELKTLRKFMFQERNWWIEDFWYLLNVLGFFFIHLSQFMFQYVQWLFDCLDALEGFWLFEERSFLVYFCHWLWTIMKAAIANLEGKW